MSLSKKIDKIAGALQAKGLNHLALDLDLVSNSLDKYAFKGEDVQGAIDTTMAELQKYRNGALKSVVWGITDALAALAEDGTDLRKDFSQGAIGKLGDIVSHELHKSGRFPENPEPFVGFDLQNFKKPETREEITHMVNNVPHVLLYVRGGDITSRSGFKASPKGCSLHISLAPIVAEAFTDILYGSKARMSEDPSHLHNLKSMLWVRVLGKLKEIVAHEMTHAYQHARVVRGEDDGSTDKEWFEQSRQRPGQEIQNYRHPTMDIETEAVREQAETELKESVKLYSPARVDKLIVPGALQSSLFADWRSHGPDDVKGVFRAMRLLEKGQLLSSAILKAWKEYILGVQGILSSSRKEFSPAMDMGAPYQARAIEQKRQVEDSKEEMRKRFQGVDLKPYLDWNPKPNMLSNKNLLP